MSLDRAVMLFAGIMVLLSVVLTVYVSHWFVLLTVFIGVNQLQASFTGFCPAAMAFKKMGIQKGYAFK